jgi:NADH:ubiquinone oxidoreductase subunit 5 (subunit L)/multisubunit Na+/H+ antiporter MnhA subunit
VPTVILAVLCVAFGILYSWPVNTLIRPVLNEAGMVAEIPGIWQSGLATILLLLGLVVGLLFYLGGRTRKATETDVFLGDEVLDANVYRVPGTQFYGSIKGLNGLRQLYGQSERGKFDLFNWVTAMFTWTAQWVYRYIDQALNNFYREVFPSLLAPLGQILQALNSRLILTYLIWAAYAGGIVAAIWQPALAPLDLLRIIASIGMLGWGLLALVETDLRRFLLFAITSQFGFVLLGSTFSWNLALIHLVSSGLAFAVLFPCCSTLRRRMKASEIEAMDGLSRVMPGQAIVFLLAALWLAGYPPFGNFFSKYLLGVTVHDAGISFSLIITATAILTLGYFLRPLRIFLRGEG